MRYEEKAIIVPITAPAKMSYLGKSVIAESIGVLDGLPVVELVNGEGSSDKAGTKNRGINSDELVHGWMIVGKDLELGVKVEVQEDEASKSSRGVARRNRLETVVDLLLVACADAAVEHDLAISIGDVHARSARTLIAFVWPVNIEVA